jgi:hypothetical protein
LRYLPGVGARIGEGEGAHTPVAVRRAADRRHLRLVQLGADGVDIVDEDDELADAFLRQAEDVICRAVPLRRTVLQEDVGVDLSWTRDSSATDDASGDWPCPRASRARARTERWG